MKKIYLLKDRLDGMEYIGQTKNDLSQRIRDGYKKGTKIREAIDRDGIENFDKEILEDNLTDEQADEREQYYIRTRNTIWPNGLNLEGGGRHNSVHSETRKRLSESQIGREFTDEHKQRLSDSHMGNHPSEETKQRMSKSHRNNPKHNCKPVRQYTKEGQFIAEYPSLHEASRRTGIGICNISECCRGNTKSSGTYLWGYSQKY